ncbi:MAG: oligosaccharide flippase family protein [Patescibacteria group bacterium]|jgi:O-antigen/teichoic acid export membrane protein
MFLNNYLKNRTIIHNFVWRVLQIFGKQGITFLILFLCAKLLTPYDFGIYNYTLAAIFFLIIFGDFGISTATSKYVAEFNTTDKEGLKLILFNSLIPILLFGTCISLVVIVFGRLFFGDDKYKFVLYVLPLIFLMPISSLLDGIFRGLKKFKILSIASLLIGLSSTVFVYILINKYGLIGALISQNIYYTLLVVVLLVIYRKLYFKFSISLIKKISTYAFLVGVANIGYFLYTKVDLIMLGKFKYVIETGYYGLISTLFSLSLMLFAILGHVIAPNNIELKIHNKNEQIKRNVKKFIFILPVIGVFMSLILYLLVPLIIRYFLPNYDNPVFFNIFHIFLFVIPIAVLEASLSNGFITPLGHVSILTKAIIIGGVLNIVFNFIFLHYFGYIGIILSTVIVHNVINITKIYIFWKKINV